MPDKSRIDDEKTFQRFKYRSADLGPKSALHVVAICGECGEPRVTPKRSADRLCRKCASIGKPSPMAGKRHTEETREKMSARHADVSGENNPMHGVSIVPSDVTRRKMSATRQGLEYDDWESFADGQEYCPRFNEACRESNREKYDRQCFLCNKTEAENMQRLSVHHIDMNKAQGCDGYSWKLTPMCKSHHGVAHTPTWMARIQYLLDHVWSGA